MPLFDVMAQHDHEQVLFCRNKDVGLKAIIAIHDTTLGPALGGCRFYDYNSEAEALNDVLRLSRGMTYKAAMAGLDLGGGKAVIIGDPTLKSEGLFRSFGRFVEGLGGRYITAEDMNTTVEDMDYIRRETQWVTGASADVGGSGDPSPVTAWGVFHGIRACLEVAFGSPDVSGRTVAIMGVGHVGYSLAKFLHERGAKLVFNDINESRLKLAIDQFGGEVVSTQDYFQLECDVLAPCALGGVVNPRTIPMVRAPIIAGAANNILESEERDAQALVERGIMYAPDYVINAGGLINVNAELKGWPASKAMADAASIFDTVKRILNKARDDKGTTLAASNHIAEERIGMATAIRRVYTR